MVQRLSLEMGRPSVLLLLLLPAVFLSLHLTTALRLPPSGSSSDRHTEVVQSPVELFEARSDYNRPSKVVQSPLELSETRSNSDRPIQVVQSPQELNEANELAFLDKLPNPIKEAIQLELKECMSFPQASYERCVYDRRALIAFTEDYSSPGSNPNPVVGSPSAG